MAAIANQNACHMVQHVLFPVKIKLYETLLEYHMPCEVVLLRVNFFKMAAIAMETAKMLKN
jgi:hypothetical protein